MTSLSSTAELATRLAAHVSDDRDKALLTQCVTEAAALVTAFTRGADVPTQVADRAVIECAAELYNRKDAPNGVKSFAEDGTALRVARDPMIAARPLLRPFLGPVVA